MSDFRARAVVLFLFGLFLSGVVAQRQAEQNEALRTTRFQAETERVIGAVVARMQHYESGLRGTRGVLLAAGDGVSRRTLRVYHASGDLAREYPGARGFGFIRRVPQEAEAAFVDAARRDGAPGFAVHQLTPHAGDRYVIQYVEPVERNRQAIGLDVASEPSRRAAAERAMRTGQATLTAPVAILQAEDHGARSFLLLLPIVPAETSVGSEAARMAETYGWSYAPLVIDEILHGLDLHDADFALSLTDLDADRGPFFVARGFEATSTALTARVSRPVLGRTWQFELRARPHFLADLNLLPPSKVFAACAITSCLLSALFWAYLVIQRRERAAQIMNARLRTIIENSSDAIIGVSLEGRVLSWNAAAERIFGHSSEQAVGRPFGTLLPIVARASEQRVHARALRGESTTAFDTVTTRADGTSLDLSVAASPITANGRVVGIGWTVRDIGVQKEAERQMQRFNALLEREVSERTALLEATKHDLRTLLDALPSMIGYWDKNLINRFANRAYHRWFGVAPESLPGTPMQTLLGPDLFARNRAYVEGALRGERQTFERALETPSGTRYSLAHYLPDVVDGEVRGFYVLVHDVTELTESRQKLAAVVRENEGLLSTLRHHMLVTVTDGKGRITDVNDAFCRLTGYTREELLGQDHKLLSSHVHPASFWTQMWSTLASGRPWRGEICNRAKDGTPHWTDSIIAPFFNERCEVVKYVCIRNDVTSSKAAHAELARERERLSNILSGTNIGTWEWNVQTGESHFNERWAGMIGYSLAELEPVSIQTFITHTHPDDVGVAQEALGRHLSGETEYYECELRMRHRDGHWLWVHDKGGIITRTPDGQPEWMYGMHSDITRSKEAQRRLAASEAFLERAGRIAGVGGWQLELATGLVYWTAETKRIHEVAPDYHPTLEGAIAFYAPEARPVIERAIDEALTSGQGWDLELPVFTEQGRQIWVRTMGERELEQDVPVRLIGAIQDITARRAADEALRRATVAAQAASAAKTEFLANMSHEIRTPLNAVIGLSYLLEQTSLKPDQASYLEKIQVASRSLLGVINDVLDLSKIEAGEMPLESAPFELPTLLRELAEVMAPQAAEKSLALRVKRAPGLPTWLRGDVTRVRQVLTNLLSNALKFTEHGHVELRVSSRSRGSGTVALACEVEDTGIGIPPDVQARLFTPFTQADASTTRRFGGTGLGLSIVQRLVDLMGGEVGLTSEPGRGSTFRVSFPLALASAPGQASQPMERGPSPLDGARLLVVDDSDVNREVAQRILERAGARVETCENGLRALAALRERGSEIDAVLMDVQMPQMDGNEATRRIREELGLGALPVIALTAGALLAERQRALEAGMNDFISKPLDPQTLIRTVRRHLTARGVLRASPVLSRPDPLPPALPPANDVWPEIEGIDGAEVADRLDHDVALFRTMLARFFQDLGDVPTQAPDDAEGRRTLSAHMHKLRGTAGSLGAQAIVQHTRAVESALRAQEPASALAPLLSHLRDALSSLARAAEPLLSSTEVGARAPVMLDVAAVETLRVLFAQHDIAALDHFSELSPALADTLGPERFEALRAAVEGLQLRHAATLLPSMRPWPARQGA